jgi:hypothetical protein
MCTYCNMGDTWFRHDPPWRRDDYPQLPQTVPYPAMPMTPHFDWSLEKLKEYHRLLKEVKELEEKLGCPCEPNKADYIGMFEERIKALEKRRDAASRTT